MVGGKSKMSYIKKRPSYQDDRPSKQKIAYRRFKRFSRPFFFLLIILGLFLGGSWFIYKFASEQQYSFIRTNLAKLIPMKITHILIDGCVLTSENEVKQALHIKIGDPILNFSIHEAQERLNNLTFVNYAIIKRQLPDTLIIHIIERSPFAVWQHQDKFMLIDRKGNIVNDHGMSGKDGQAFLKLPLVVGIGANHAASDLIDILSVYPEIKERVVAAIRIGNRRWNLNLKDGTVILLPENQELPAIQRLMQYQKQFQLLDRPVKNIDLRLPDRLIIQTDDKMASPHENDDHSDTPDKNTPSPP